MLPECNPRRTHDREQPQSLYRLAKSIDHRADASATRFATRTRNVAKPKLGHGWMLEDPDDINQMLRAFWGEL
ncbi:MAG: hypothetical protein ACI8W3_001682 [Myxococcota bacterium]|jgi:hypothetical protein